MCTECPAPGPRLRTMRVVVLPADETGCGSYRCIWPAKALQDAHPDWQVEIHQPGTVQVGTDRKRSFTAIQGLDLNGIDVAVMQRIGTPMALMLMRALQKRGAAVVVDADDALWCIHRDNQAYKAWNYDRNRVNPTHWSTMDQAAKEADLVTVTTPRLAARYGAHGRVEVLPNRVPAEVCDILPVEPDGGGPVFGWSGFVATHPADLHAVGNAVRRVMADIPAARIKIVGDGRGLAQAWGLDATVEGRVGATGAVPIHAYYDALGILDVGLVPLETSVFNKCKSGLKVAEFAARGIATIATPTPANVALAKEGYPVLFADSPREWSAHLTRLLKDPDLTAEIADRGREAARSWSLENQVEVWGRAWERAMVRRHRLTA